jgi:hypothetical protein
MWHEHLWDLIVLKRVRVSDLVMVWYDSAFTVSSKHKNMKHIVFYLGMDSNRLLCTLLDIGKGICLQAVALVTVYFISLFLQLIRSLIKRVKSCNSWFIILYRGRTVVNFEVERMWKQATVVNFNLLSQNLPLRTEENCDKSHSAVQAVSGATL